jgi:hypothetical protein
VCDAHCVMLSMMMPTNRFNTKNVQMHMKAKK